ncbi:MAG: tRNA dihydrouridine synthase DusB [Aggregatilineales bacterium]
MKDTWLKPIRIGTITIDPPLTLAPMAGQTNHPFRVLCREKGECGLVCTELLSSTAMHYKSQKTLQMFDWSAAESPFAVQLFGGDPAVMADAARLVVDQGADIVDINMGCWVPKVAKTGAGAALLRDVCTATRVVEAVVNAVSVPVTVKVRSGWDAQNLTAVEFARAAEQVGVSAIAVHARTAAQGFSGEPDWGMIRRVKEAIKIPVLGNGDVRTPEDAARMFTETGCDGVMIGRAALGNPWIFRQVAHYLSTGEKLSRPSAKELAATALRHAQITLETTKFPERTAILELRGQLTKYHLGTPDAAALRNALVHAESMADIEAIFAPIIENGGTVGAVDMVEKAGVR